MDEPSGALPILPAPPAAETVPARPVADPLPWWWALIQVILVSGVPTQLVIVIVLAVLHNLPLLGGDTSNISLEYFNSLEFFATVAFWDTAVIALLMRVFLALSREDPRDVFLGKRPVFGEAWRGLALVPVAFILVVALVAGLRYFAPWMHNVQESPLEQFMRTPLDAAIFLVVVVLAGGIREELQRGFILHRFDQRLGGIRVGLAVFTLVFGALHFEQGYDVALAVGVLGLAWGLFYMRRRSIVMGVVNHAGFDALQVIQVLIARSLGL